MRIITGSAKGTKLNTLDGAATRPTLERVKEAVFSTLQFDLEGRKVLDLFAGSGQLALEALSRGAASATLVDRSRDAIKIITSNAEKTRLSAKCRIVQSDYTDFLARDDCQYDIVFLDPPYAGKMYTPALILLNDRKAIKPTSIIVCESGDASVCEDAEVKARYDVKKQAKYGNSFITVLSPR